MFQLLSNRLSFSEAFAIFVAVAVMIDIGSEVGFNRDKIDINSSRLLSLVRLGVTSCTHKRDVRRLVRPGGTLSLLSLLPAQTPSPS